MSISTTLPSGLTVTSSGLTQREMNRAMQSLICMCLGIPVDQGIIASVTAGSNQIQVSIGDASESWEIDGDSLPLGVTILAIDGNTWTLSDPATATEENASLLVSDPRCNTAVRINFGTQGQPAWGITDDVVFLQCMEESSEYNTVRNAEFGTAVDGYVPQDEQYSRAWMVSLEFRGPSSYSTAALVKTVLGLDEAHDTLAVSNLYLRPDISAPQRAPELIGGQWWERTNLELHLLEDVKESFSVPVVSSAEIIALTSSGIVSDVVIARPVPVPPPMSLLYGEGGYGEGTYPG